MSMSIIEKINKLKASIERGSLAEDYSPGDILTFSSFQVAFFAQQNAKPNDQGSLPLVDMAPLIGAYKQWPEKDKWQFVNHWCDNLSVVTYTKLMPEIKNTAELGQNAVVSLISKEIELSGRLNVSPDEERVAGWIESYTGRINLLPDIRRLMAQNFPESSLIDSALAGLVDQHIAKQDSFNHVSRDSDFFITTKYPKTFEKHLSHYSNRHLDFDVVELYFRDMFISNAGVKPEYLQAYQNVMGDRLVVELMASNAITQHNCSGNGPINSLNLALSIFGEDALLETPQMKDYLSQLKGDKPDLGLISWVSTQRLALADSAPTLHEVCLNQLPGLMKSKFLIPSESIMKSGVRIMGGEGFLKHFLHSVRQAFDQNVNGNRDFSRFQSELNSEGLVAQSMTDFDLIQYAYANPMRTNNPVAIAIRNACHSAGIEETAKIAGNMSIQASENLYKNVALADRKLVVQHFPNSQVLALERDLGL